MLRTALKALIVAGMFVAATSAADAAIIIQNSTPGYYNSSIGTSLNNTNGGNTATGYFPTTNDSNATFTIAPDLSTASSALGNWLTNPANLNANWGYQSPIPMTWTLGHEVAVLYRIDTLGATNVLASFGVDNGIFVWFDGVFLGGARRTGGPVLGEHQFAIGNVSAGNHYLQVLLEDHGTANGYLVQVTADTFLPAPEPTSLLLAGMGVCGVVAARLRRRAHTAA